MPQVTEGAQRSPDGHYWLDEHNQWQPVPADDPQHPNNVSSSSSAAAAGAAAATPAAAAGAAAGEMTHEELTAITSGDQIDERAYPYFQPDYDTYPDDTSAAETQDHLSDEPVQGGV
jgi:hypothetical protein